MTAQTFTFRARRAIQCGDRRVDLEVEASWKSQTGTPHVILQGLRQQTRDELELQAAQVQAELETKADPDKPLPVLPPTRRP